MRVITGECRGRKLETPEDYSIRPTSDKVKEAMFNLLMYDTAGRTFLDLFGGTGGLGIEALSRGAEKCYFGDRSRAATQLIQKNLIHCGLEHRAVVLTGDYQKCLRRIDEKLDVILLDPPYQGNLYIPCLEQIDFLDLLDTDGIILAEHRSGDVLPDSVGDLECVRSRKYGKTTLSIYRKKERAEQQDE